MIRRFVLIFVLIVSGAHAAIGEVHAPLLHTHSRKLQIRKALPQCSDRRDNDGDGKRDYPRDPGCVSKRDNRERNPRPTPTPQPTLPGGTPDLGVGASLNGRRVFPEDSPWNMDISSKEVDPNSASLIASIGAATGLHPDWGTFYNGSPIGIPYVVVPGTQSKSSVQFDYADESDAGPYPIPSNPPIEGGNDSDGDRHILMIDRDNWILYELFYAFNSSNHWTAGSGALFNLNSNALRPAGWTSADAAGLPIFPGLVRYDEVFERGEITHALRFTARRTRRAYVFPARHFASSDSSPSLPPMGMRVRLKANVNISTYPEPVQVVLRALKKYGMFLADNGSDWFISGAHDERWDDAQLSTIRSIKGGDFEVIKMDDIVTH